MVAVVALAKQEALPVDEIGATFVVPAPRGCDLACPFCFIRMRGEAGQAERQLSERNYHRISRPVEQAVSYWPGQLAGL